MDVHKFGNREVLPYTYREGMYSELTDLPYREATIYRMEDNGRKIPVGSALLREDFTNKYAYLCGLELDNEYNSTIDKFKYIMSIAEAYADIGFTKLHYNYHILNIKK